MKLSFWDRVLAALYVLLSLALCVCVALRSLGFDIFGAFYRDLAQATKYWFLIYYGALVILVLLGVYMLALIFRRKPKRSEFVTVDSGENGKVVIAMEAVEQMVRQAATKSEGISDMKINVVGLEDSISVLAELTVQGGVHLPTISMNLQQEIRRYIEVNCGIAVRDVAVTVGAVLPPEGEASAPENSKKTFEAPWKKHPTEEQRAEEHRTENAPAAEPAIPEPETAEPEPIKGPVEAEVIEEEAPEEEPVVVPEEPAEPAVEEPLDEERIEDLGAEGPEDFGGDGEERWISADDPED